MRATLSWLRTGRRPLWAAAVIVVLIILSVVIKPIAGYATEQPQLVAALIALAGILATQIFNTILARAGQRNQQELEGQRARAASLQSYLEQMGKLIIEHQLRKKVLSNSNNEADSNRADDAPVVARAQTLAVLKGLKWDPDRKRVLMLFLAEAHLIERGKEVFNLRLADLSRANLANLRGDVLSNKNLCEANLEYANFSNTDLSSTDLSGTDLGGAKGLTQEQLEQAFGDETTKLPKGLTLPASWTTSTDEQTTKDE